MKNLTILSKYFPTGTAEGERHILDKVFVTSNQLPEILNSPPGSPKLLLGRKGVGKTALMEWLKAEFTKSEIPCILLRPDDIEASELLSGDDIGSLKRKIYTSLVQAVSAKIGSELKGLVVGDQMRLYEEAVRNGSRDISFLRQFIETVGAIARPTAKVDTGALVARLTGSLAVGSLAAAIESTLESKASSFYLFIDDSDQIASPNEANHLNRIWALILAARKLTQECPSLQCIMSLRTEVWLRLSKNERGQRDQVDHIRPLTVTLRASEFHITAIIQKRLKAAAIEAKRENEDPFSVFFERNDVKLPTSAERRSWKSLFIKSARERPRDAVQFVSHLIKYALKRGGTRISDEDVEYAMRDYSKERSEDLGVEFGDICSNLAQVIRAFAGCPFEMTFEELRKVLKSIPSSLGVQVYGKTVHRDDDDDAMMLLSVLHEADFINAKKADLDMDREFNHITFLDDPHLVQKDRWNELQALHWEIHPVFRSYLMSIQPLKPPVSKFVSSEGGRGKGKGKRGKRYR